MTLATSPRRVVMADEVLYDKRDRVAVITLNRPEYANAQNSAMTYALDAAFARAVNDDVEYFARPWVLGPRFAREVLFTGGRFGAERACQVGMVNRVVPRASLEPVVFELAGQIAEMPPFALALAKRAGRRRARVMID
jgi:enoyl-CoA hydratase/carnithine racemase